VEAFIKLVQDVESNGKSMVVMKDLGGIYRRRIIVDDDGVSNPELVDQPLTVHPPVPGNPSAGSV
jgi:hypothetical protein